MIASVQPLRKALLEPVSTRALSAAEWNELLWSARQRALLAPLGARLEVHGVLEHAPAKARDHFAAAFIAARSSQVAVRYELNRVQRALRDYDGPLVLLKGAAYLAAELPPARGRDVGDLDVLVPRERIEEVEARLRTGGWTSGPQDPYDDRFYREWGHEIPPLQHPKRETPVDVHHTIVPPTSPVHPDAAALLEQAVPCGTSGCRMLAPADMVLHSTVHLFNDQVGRPLRDLLDLHELMTHFSATRPSFWNDLIERAALHGMTRTLLYMLRACSRTFGTTVPPEVMRDVQRSAGRGRAALGIMDVASDLRFAAPVLGHPSRGERVGQAFFLARAQALRMPPAMLARHLVVKATRRIRARSAQTPAKAATKTAVAGPEGG